MADVENSPSETPHATTLCARLAGFVRKMRGDDSQWFDDPEMQARIEKAESDRRESRVERFESREAAFAHLDELV